MSRQSWGEKLICCYVFSFHSMNLPLLAAGAAFPGASFCLRLSFRARPFPAPLLKNNALAVPLPQSFLKERRYSVLSADRLHGFCL